MSLLETYIKDLRDIRSTGASVKETSYPALSNLFNEVGKTLKPTSINRAINSVSIRLCDG